MQFLVNVKEKSNVLFALGQPVRKAGQPAGSRSLAPRQRRARQVLPTGAHWGRRQDATQSNLDTLGFSPRTLLFSLCLATCQVLKSVSVLFFFSVAPQPPTVSPQNVCNCCVSMSWHPLLTWFMTFCLSCATCSLSMLAVDASSEVCAFKVFTFSSHHIWLAHLISLFNHRVSLLLLPSASSKPWGFFRNENQVSSFPCLTPRRGQGTPEFLSGCHARCFDPSLPLQRYRSLQLLTSHPPLWQLHSTDHFTAPWIYLSRKDFPLQLLYLCNFSSSFSPSLRVFLLWKAFCYLFS